MCRAMTLGLHSSEEFWANSGAPTHGTLRSAQLFKGSRAIKISLLRSEESSSFFGGASNPVGPEKLRNLVAATSPHSVPASLKEWDRRHQVQNRVDHVRRYASQTEPSSFSMPQRN